MSVDAVVVGAGICGAATAYHLKERGLDVLVVDRAGIVRGVQVGFNDDVKSLLAEKIAPLLKEFAAQ